MEKENDIIYDLDAPGQDINETPEETAQSPQSEESDQSDQSDQLDQSAQLAQLDQSDQSDQLDQSDQSYQLDQSEESDQPDQSDNSDNPDNSDNSEAEEKSPAEAELQKMLDEVGADTLLEIIRDNRNAAIKQIISEMQAAQPKTLRSGTSVSSPCNSIFDLAAMA